MPTFYQSGLPSLEELLEIFVWFVPSAFIMKTFDAKKGELPSRLLLKAMCLPLVDQASVVSNAGLSVRRVCPVLSLFIT